jgi:two-component system, cell cycle response regulator CpdR
LLHLMIVDDDEAVLRLLRIALELDGFKNVDTFSHPEAAVRAFELKPAAYDLVVTDIMMPGMTGTELAARILTTQPRIPIVFITGCAIAADVPAQELLRKFPTVAKPSEISMLARTVRRQFET